MLIRITESCTMNCNHCMINATSDGHHMSFETFQQTLKFIYDLSEYKDPLLISGEPTDHPQFFEFIKEATSKGFFVLVMSNGLFLNNEDFKRKVIDLNIAVQITNDKRYYPTQIPIINHDKFSYETSIQTLSPFGRARENKLPTTTKTPHCFNLRSITRKIKHLPAIIIYLRSHGKFCTPSINIDGSISAGESNQCFKIGHISQSFDSIVDQILNMNCNKCGLESNLEDIHKQAIGL